MRSRRTRSQDRPAELITESAPGKSSVVRRPHDLAHDRVDLGEGRNLVAGVDREPAPGELEGQPGRVLLARGIRHRPLAIRSMSSGPTVIIRPPLPSSPSVSNTDGKIAMASADAESLSA